MHTNFRGFLIRTTENIKPDDYMLKPSADPKGQKTIHLCKPYACLWTRHCKLATSIVEHAYEQWYYLLCGSLWTANKFAKALLRPATSKRTDKQHHHQFIYSREAFGICLGHVWEVWQSICTCTVPWGASEAPPALAEDDPGRNLSKSRTDSSILAHLDKATHVAR